MVERMNDLVRRDKGILDKYVLDRDIELLEDSSITEGRSLDGELVTIKKFGVPHNAREWGSAESRAGREVFVLKQAMRANRQDIPRYVGDGKDGDMQLPVIVTEPIKGQRLSELVNSDERTYSLEEGIQLARSVGATLNWGHNLMQAPAGDDAIVTNRRLIHRALSPEHIIKTDSGYVVDGWGWAEFEGNEDNKHAGEEHYAAPEAFTGQEVTPASDVHSLARVMQHYFLGTKFNDIMEDKVTVKASDFDSERVPKHTIDAMIRGASSNPSRRQQTIDEFLLQLEEETGLAIVESETGLKKRKDTWLTQPDLTGGASLFKGVAYGSMMATMMFVALPTFCKHAWSTMTEYKDKQVDLKAGLTAGAGFTSATLGAYEVLSTYLAPILSSGATKIGSLALLITAAIVVSNIASGARECINSTDKTDHHKKAKAHYKEMATEARRISYAGEGDLEKQLLRMELVRQDVPGLEAFDDEAHLRQRYEDNKHRNVHAAVSGAVDLYLDGKRPSQLNQNILDGARLLAQQKCDMMDFPYMGCIERKNVVGEFKRRARDHFGSELRSLRSSDWEQNYEELESKVAVLREYLVATEIEDIAGINIGPGMRQLSEVLSNHYSNQYKRLQERIRDNLSLEFVDQELSALIGFGENTGQLSTEYSNNVRDEMYGVRAKVLAERVRDHTQSYGSFFRNLEDLNDLVEEKGLGTDVDEAIAGYLIGGLRVLLAEIRESMGDPIDAKPLKYHGQLTVYENILKREGGDCVQVQSDINEAKHCLAGLARVHVAKGMNHLIYELSEGITDKHQIPDRLIDYRAVADGCGVDWDENLEHLVVRAGVLYN